MRILHIVEAYPPEMGGMAEVVKQLSEGLAKKGHAVTVATGFCEQREAELQKLIKDDQRQELDDKWSHSDISQVPGVRPNRVKVEEFKITGRSVHGIKGDPEEIARYCNLLLSDQFDIIVIFAAQIWSADLAFDVFNDIKAKLVWVPTGLSGLKIKTFKEYYQKISQLVKGFDLGVFLSDQYQDWEYCRHFGLKNMTVITNGASEKEFGDEATEEEIKDLESILPDIRKRDLIVHIGSHTGLKGHKELMWMYARAKLNRSSTLLLIGNKSPNGCYSDCSMRSRLLNFYFKSHIVNKKVAMVDRMNRTRTVTALKLAKLFLFPSNVECSPIVLFEAMAAKTPFLTTPAGNSAQIAQWFEQDKVILPVKRKKTLVFANINKSAKMLADLMNNEERLDELATKGHTIWQKKYTWEKLVEQYEKEYLKLI